MLWNSRTRTLCTLLGLAFPALTLGSGIKDIIWAPGTPLPWPTKEQPQAVLGDSIVAACAPSYPGWDPRKARDRGQYNSGWLFGTDNSKQGWCELPPSPASAANPWPPLSLEKTSTFLVVST